MIYLTMWIYWILLILVGCGPASLDDLRWEADAQMAKLVAELRSIGSKAELQRKIPKLRQRFNEIADLLIEVRKFSVQEGKPSLVAEQLFAELARLYEMPGGREWIETAQMEAVQRLLSSNR